MACNRPNPQVHHRFIPHKVLQYGVDSIFQRGSQLLAIFFMQLGGKSSLGKNSERKPIYYPFGGVLCSPKDYGGSLG